MDQEQNCDPRNAYRASDVGLIFLFNRVLNSSQKRVRVPSSIVARAIEEERRCAVDAASDSAKKVLTDTSCMLMLGQVTGELRHIQPKHCGITDQILTSK